MKGFVVAVITIFISVSALGNNKDTTNQTPGFYKDTFNLAQHFSKGHVKGHVRNFFMNTINEGSLRDYWTNAIGMSLHYESLPFYGFMFEMKGIFTFQTISSDLNYIDPLSGKSSKWEIELYDILDRNNKTDLDRLEELFIHYQWKNSFVRYGRIPIDKTPLVNARDGRMKPFAFEGAYSEIGISKKWKIKSMIIHGVSPRSTVEWFQFHEAIGLNNNGFTPMGEKAEYHEHLDSRFLFGQEIKFQDKNFSASFWEFYFDKLFNLNWGQMEVKSKHFKLGIIGVNQFGLKEQKELEIVNQYYTPGTRAHVASELIEFKNGDWKYKAARSDVFGNGKFLFPRELGRERLYTSITRSWMDGFGKSSMTNFGINYKPKKKKELELDLVTSFVKTPGQTNYAFNKYGTRDYIQTNFEIDYNFEGRLKGLELDLLYIYVKDVHAKTITYEEAANKTNFHQINLIMNINF